MKKLFFPLVLCASVNIQAQTATITVNATQNISPISPWIYGRNNNISDDPASPVSASTWKMYNDAGLRFYRENGGNNCTKYNWRLKLSSHPDWFNNVYSHDWDYSAGSLINNTSNTQGLYGFQLLGQVASNTNNNFNDWAYTQAGGTGSPSNNWAGGGGPIAYGGNGGVGNPALYLENWSADSTVGILNHWFSGLAIDSNRFQYWSMDNEPDIWQSTHDDIALSSMVAEDYMQKYFAVAKAARKKYPDIKLVGPVFSNEWGWYNWNNNVVQGTDKKNYSLIEYFVKRIGEEQKASGIRLLDVLDVHFYPSTSADPSTTLQLHRVWFDTTWVYNGANGVKRVGPLAWNNNVNKEYLFQRCNQWLNNYVGTNHNVKFSVSEYGDQAVHGSENANVVACWYASHLGLFANKGIAFFTPWDWYVGQWEVLHLFSNYYGTFATQASSNLDSLVSGYSSISADGDSLMIAIVNKDQVNSRSVNLNIQNFAYSDSTVNGYQLANLPGTETFVSKSSNALQSKQYTISGNKMAISVPKLSVTIIQIPTNKAITTPTGIVENNGMKVNVFPNPANNEIQIQVEKEGIYYVSLYDVLGQKTGEWNFSSSQQLDISSFAAGNYLLQIRNNDQVMMQKIIKY